MKNFKLLPLLARLQSQFKGRTLMTSSSVDILFVIKSGEKSKIWGQYFSRKLISHVKTHRSPTFNNENAFFGFDLVDSLKLQIFHNLGLAVASLKIGEVERLDEIENAFDEVHLLPELELIKPQFTGALSTIPHGVSWGIAKLGIEALWAKGLNGDGITVGHLDTGVDTTHPSLSQSIAFSAEIRSGGALVEGNEYFDSGRHGTHTAGIICGTEFDGAQFGCAPRAKLASAIVIEGGDVTRRVLRGLDWCIERNVRIVNLSVGVPGYDRAFEPIMSAMRARNVLAIIAVGNEGPNTSRSPGNYVQALSVGAIQPDGAIWPQSSSQSFDRAEDPLVPDLYAPGAEVWSAWPGGSVMQLSGTSMAAPHLAGLAALLLQAVPSATASEIESAIRGSIEASTGPSIGCPNGFRALELLQSN